jgi:hypothetical protein
MANTTWNPSDKSATITLSGGNLTATSTSSGIIAARAIDRQVAGKFYWECLCSTFTGSGSAVGFACSSAALGSGLASAGSSPGTVGLGRGGTIIVDGVSTGISLATVTSGTLVGIAVDLSSRLVWFRLGAAGNWNANAANNPATGVGGISIPTLGIGIPAYPAVSFQANADAVTANFGDSAFTGTLPSGFTSGFTAGASIATNELATQLAVEQWAATNPDMQATQLAIEQWGGLPAPPLWVTQAALEQWSATPRPPLWVTQAALEQWSETPTPPFWVTQVALEHWTSGSASAQIAVTQVALEHWVGTPATVITVPMGPMITTIF